MTDILNNFMAYIATRKIPIANGVDLIAELNTFILDSYRQKIIVNNKSILSIGEYILNQSRFGVGMYVNGVPYIAGWDGKYTFDCTQQRYLDAAFNFDYLNSYTKLNITNPNQCLQVLNSIEVHKAFYTLPQMMGFLFINNVIIAAKEVFSPEHVQNAISRIDNASIIPTGYNLFINPKPLIFVPEVTGTPPPHERYLKRCKF